MSQTRNLTVLQADACGFTAAMHRSETLAISKLLAGQRLLRTVSALYGGRVVDMAGDSALVVFDQEEAAFRAAQAFQEQSGETTKGPAQETFQYRVGLAQGQVNILGKRVFGHVVNLAARIQSLVRAGHIGVEQGLWTRVRAVAADKKHCSRALFVRPEEPAIRFVEVTGRQGLSDSLTTDLQAHNAPFISITVSCDGVSTALAKIAKEALIWETVAYIKSQGWDCNLLPAGNSVELLNSPNTFSDYIACIRVTGTTLGVRTGLSIATRHGRQGLQIFTQEASNEEEVTRSTLALVSHMGSAIQHCETERIIGHGNAGAFQLTTAGREYISTFTPSSIETGLGILKKGLELDPEFPILLSSLGRAYAIAWRFAGQDSSAENLELAMQYAERAVRISPTDPRCHGDLGFVQFWNKQAADSVWHYERSLTALPFHAELAADAGMVLSYLGRNDEAAAILERSVANLPLEADYRLWSLGDVFFAKRDYKQALEWLNRMSDQSQAQRLLAAIKARLGLDPSSHVAAVLQQQPEFSVNHWISIQPFARDEDREDYQSALLLAGLPP